MPRPKSFSEPIYTRLPEDVMKIFEEARKESGKSKSEFARELISDRLRELKGVLEGEDDNQS